MCVACLLQPTCILKSDAFIAVAEVGQIWSRSHSVVQTAGFSRIDLTGRTDYSQFRGLQRAHRNNGWNRGWREAAEQKTMCDLNLVLEPWVSKVLKCISYCCTSKKILTPTATTAVLTTTTTTIQKLLYNEVMQFQEKAVWTNIFLVPEITSVFPHMIKNHIKYVTKFNLSWI